MGPQVECDQPTVHTNPPEEGAAVAPGPGFATRLAAEAVRRAEVRRAGGQR